jgi:hypothetical protein
MSTDYRPLKNIRACELFDGRLEAFGVREHVHKETDNTNRCLTDGNNFLWVYTDENGDWVEGLTRYFPCGNPEKILVAMEEAFDTDIVSEHQPQFWGFDTEEEWHAALEAANKEHEEEFHAEVLKFVRDEPNNIRQGTNGWYEAKHAKELVEKDPSLLLPANHDKLFNAAHSYWFDKHVVKVTLTEKEVALARMLGTHEDDLPQA